MWERKLCISSEYLWELEYKGVMQFCVTILMVVERLMPLGRDLPCGSMVAPANAGDRDSIPWVGKIRGRRKWQPTPVFLPGKSHGQRSLASYSPWDCKRVGVT